MIAVTITAVTTATVAYFTSTATKTGNTFAMGTVTLNNDWTTGFPFSFNDLTPGLATVSGVLGVGYGGSLPADLYFGVKAETGYDLRPILDYYIEEVDSTGITHIADLFGWTGVNDAFLNWNKIADNVTNGNWRYYKVHLRVHADADNTYQGKSATNTIFIHAVQHGQSAPATPPWSYTP